MKKTFVMLFLITFCLSGCALVDAIYGKKEGGKSIAEHIQDVVKVLPYGDIISSVIGLGGLAYGTNSHIKHRKSKKENIILKQKLAAVSPAPPIV